MSGIPPAVGALGQKVASAGPLKNLPVAAIERQLSQAVNAKDSLLRTAALNILDNEIPMGKTGLRQLREVKKQAGQEIGQIIDDLSASGAKVDVKAIAAEVRRRGNKVAEGMADVNLSKPYHDWADTFLTQVRNTYGQRALNNGLDIKAVQKMRIQTGQNLADYYKTANKVETEVGTHSNRARAAGYTEAGSQISQGARATDIPKAKRLAKANRDYHTAATTESMLDMIVKKRRKRQVVGSDITIPMAVELGGGGQLGTATAIAGFRRYVLDPASEYGAKILHNRQRGKQIVRNKTARKAIKGVAGVTETSAWLHSLLEDQVGKTTE
jgi:hypothetical protein